LSTKFRPEDIPAITVIRIDTDRADRKKIFWEYLVKTYMSQQRWIQAIEDNQIYHIDKLLAESGLEITDCKRIEFINNVIKQEFHPQLTPTVDRLSCVDIEYNELFIEDGSKKLCKKLNLTVDNCYHQLWNNNLKMCSSPHTIVKFGKIWNYTDL
jgi:hypothetical protein